MYRGGIPIVFPQFSQPDKSMSQHGFARNSLWNVESHKIEDDSVTVTFSFIENESTLAVWPKSFKLLYEVNLSFKSLSTSLTVVNTGEAEFNCHTLLHTYIAVPNVAEISVVGFKNRTYIDSLTKETLNEEQESNIIDQEVDRIILGDSPSSQISPVEIYNSKTGSKIISVDISSSLGSESYPFDVVFWNAWAEKAKSLADMGDDEYFNYVCIEPGTVSKFVTVTPSNTLVIKQTLTSG